MSEIETEQRLVAANRELTERFEQKIAATLAHERKLKAQLMEALTR